MSDLIAFLRRCLDDDERVAREAASGPAGASWTAGTDGLAMPYIAGAKSDDGQWLRSVAQPEEIEYGPHIACHDPARVLAEVDAKREILDDCAEYVAAGTEAATDGLAGRTLIALAQPYAGRDGWREEWRV